MAYCAQGEPFDARHRPRRHARVDSTLAKGAGRAPDSRAVAETTITTWHHLVTQLSPVIGERGVDVLFNRSLTLASTAFPWFAPGGEFGLGGVPLTALKSRLAAHDVTTALHASQALFMTFTELLSALIGASLTEQLLRPVWSGSQTPAENDS